MKRKDYFQLRSADRHVSMRSTIQRAARLAAAAACILIAAAACTNDPIADNDDNNLHDVTPVPFSFTAIAPPALTDVNTTTRTVTGKDTWIGDGTEKIGVRLILVDWGSQSMSTGTYTITSPQGSTAVLPDDQPALWPSKSDDGTIHAWYPAKDAGYEFDVSDQSTPEKLRQADLLKATNSGFFYNSTPVLEFEHQMTKVRVVLTGVDAASNADIEVGILGVTRFTLNEFGQIVFSSQPQDYITACRDTDTEDPNDVAFEALLPVNKTFFTITKQRFIRVTVGNQTYYFSPTEAARKDLYYGKLYTYTVPIPAATPTTRTNTTNDSICITL